MAKASPRHDRMQPLGLRAWRGRSNPAMPRPHSHGDLELNYILRGSLTYLIRERMVRLPARRLCLLWGATLHQTIAAAPDHELIWVTAPLEMAWRLNLPRHRLGALMSGGCLIDPIQRPADEPQLLSWVRDLRSDDAGTRRIVELEVEARLLRLLQQADEAHAGSETPDAPGPTAADAIARMAELIGQRYRDDLSVADIAAAAGLSESHAITRFRQHTGLTPIQYLNRQRLHHAQRLLLTTDQPIAEVALASGFGSTSWFHEHFKREAGLSPRRYRQQNRGGAGAGET